MAILDFYVLNLTTLNVKYVWFHLSEVQKQVKWLNGNRSQDSGCLGWGWGWVQRVFKKLDIFNLWADRNPLVNLTPIPLQPCPTNLMWLNLRNPIGWKWRRQKCKREIHCLKNKRLNGRSEQVNRKEALTTTMHCAFHKHCHFALG